MDFPPIPDDFGSMDNASFTFIDLDLEVGGMEFTQTGTNTFTIVGVIETAGTNGGGSSHPSGSQSYPGPPRLSRGGSIPIIHSLKTHA